MKTYNFTIRGNKYSVDIKSFEENIAEIEVNGSHYMVELEREVKTTKTPKLVRSAKPLQAEPKKVEPGAGLSKINAPLPGTIFKIKAKVGDKVKKGDMVLIMEAMKMENNINAEKDGTIKTIHVKEGDAVLQGDVLIEIE